MNYKVGCKQAVGSDAEHSKGVYSFVQRPDITRVRSFGGDVIYPGVYSTLDIRDTEEDKLRG